MSHRVERFREYVYVEVFELWLQHEVVVPDADGAQGVQSIVLDLGLVVEHEEERGLEDLLDGVGTGLEIKARLVVVLRIKKLLFLTFRSS